MSDERKNDWMDDPYLLRIHMNQLFDEGKLFPATDPQPQPEPPKPLPWWKRIFTR